MKMPTAKTVKSQEMEGISFGLRLPVTLIAAAMVICAVAPAQDRAQVALEQALRHADLYNWADAAPFFEEAERLFQERGDEKNQLYAHLGYIRGTMERVSLPETSDWLTDQLGANPLLQGDTDLRLFGLVVKADIDGELDAGPMRRDWEAVQQLARRLGNSKWVNRASGEIGFAAFLEGDIVEAKRLVATTLIGATMSGDFGAQIRYLAAIGTGLVLMRSPAESLGYFDKAAGIAKQHPEAGYQFLVHEGRVMALKALGRLEEARSAADDVLREARSRQKHVKECQVLITSARISLAEKNHDRAQIELEQAMQLATNGGFKRLLANAHAVLADVLIAKGDLARAETAAMTAVELTQSSGDLYLVPGRLELLAKIKAMRGNFADADADYRHAADFVDAMLANAPPAAKASLILAMSDVYTEHFTLAAEALRNPAAAYEVVERARGRITTDLLRAGVRETPEQARDTERRISALHIKLTKAKTRTEVREIRDEIFLIEKSRWMNPSRERSRMDGAVVTPIADVQRSLQHGEMLLEYVLAEPKSFCLVVTTKSIRLVTLPARSAIEKLIEEYVQSVRGKQPALRLAQDLHRILLAGVPALGSHQRLTVVADGYLHLLPFEALVDGAAGQYLIKTHTVTTAVSATAFYLQRHRPAAPASGNRVLAVGGIPYESGPTPEVALLQRAGATTLGALPSSEDEAVAAAGAIKGLESKILTGRDATEAAFKQAELSSQRAIHLAVHGLADKTHPDHAGLVMLSSPADQEDGILQGSEIVQLRLNADLVVLSACDTAVGRLLGQEGIGTLSRAFQLAGAKSVVSTLWATDDTFALNLMRRFYSRLGRGQTLAAALTGAKRELLNEFGSRAVPYYWAGFVLSGAADRSLIATRKTKEKESYAAHQN